MKTLIMFLALTLAATQPLIAWEEDVSYEGANTAEEVRRLREDLQEAREEDKTRRLEAEEEADRIETSKKINDAWDQQFGNK